MTIGAANLLDEYEGNRLAIAEALLRGEINNSDQKYVEELIDKIILDAAKFRVLNDMHTKKSRKK